MKFDIRKDLSIDISAKALKAYSENFEKAFSLNGDIAIFLDTNILLSYYGMAASEKAKLLTFFKENKSNIYLTAQVQEEFRRNRVKNIENDLFEPLRKIPEGLDSTCNDIKNKFSSFLNSNKKILSNDYPEQWDKLVTTQDELSKLLSIEGVLNELKERVDETTTNFKDIKVVDDLLFESAELMTTEKLKEKEISEIEALYDELIDNHKKSSSSNKPYSVFPGSGDFGQKEYPYGDFIIYHEILKFMVEEKRDAIFLTNEKSKGDWISDNYTPHIHYIEHTYFLTGKSIFILNAEKPLSLSFANIHRIVSVTNGILREGVVSNINHNRGFGFVFNKEESVYFNLRDFEDSSDFFNLKKQDYLSFNLSSNSEGRPIAINCKRRSYSFDDSGFEPQTGRVINLSNRYGFVDSENDNIYFHSLTVDDGCNFNDFKLGSKVEYLTGVNFDGDPIIRKIRLAKNIILE